MRKRLITNMQTVPPKISVIVAVYNVDKWLRRALDCLKKQTFSDFEVILVDDGSMDDSGKICDEYVAKDSRFHVIHKKNGGVSSARECGVRTARGEFLIHADPDDWTEPQMLSHLYETAVKEKADMVISDFYCETPETVDYCVQCPSNLNHASVLSDLFQEKVLGCSWNKLVRRDIFSTFDIHYPDDISYGEDLLVNIFLLQEELTIAYLPEALVHYSMGFRKTLSLLDEKRKFQSTKHFLSHLRTKVKKDFSQMILSRIEQVCAYMSLTNGEWKDNKHFKELYPVLYEEYKSLNMTRKRKICYFLAFHGFAGIISFLTSLRKACQR